MNNDPKLLEHEVDGIRELDNLLPRWWVWLFNLTIVFGAIYMLYYHVFRFGDLQAAEYAKESKAGDQLKAAAIASFESSIATLEPSKDKAVIVKASESSSPIAPHAIARTAADWSVRIFVTITGFTARTIVDNVKTIINGVPAKGMITWRGMLKPGQIQAVGSYIYTLHGSNPKNPEPPENTMQAPTGPGAYE